MTLHDKEHPLICLYKNTLTEDFPIILVIGREPNNNTPIVNKVGLYDFDGTSHGRKCSKCAFWNMSYKLIAELNNLSVDGLKEICRRQENSLVAYADSLPQGIMNQDKNKDKIRKSIEEDTIKKHIENIFSKEIIKRVKLIILSGIDGNKFKLSVSMIKEISNDKMIKFVEVPFFFPSNYNRMKLNNEEKNIIRRIFSEWKISV